MTTTSVLRENNPSYLTDIDKQAGIQQTGQEISKIESEILEECEKGISYCDLDDTLNGSSNDDDSFEEMASLDSNNKISSK